MKNIQSIRTIRLYSIAALIAAGVIVVLYIAGQIGSLRTYPLRGVTKELANWEKLYGSVGNLQEAERAAEMIEYIQGYYVPQEGLRADPETERQLAEQRRRTLEAIRSALAKFSGEDFGLDSGKWLAWIESKKTKRAAESGQGDLQEKSN